MYKVRLVQFIAPEHGEDGNRYAAEKDIELPFPPTKELGIMYKDLGPYLWFTNHIHYDLNEERFYVTINARWMQVWDGNEYLWDETIKELEEYVEKLRSSGWKVEEKPYSD